MTARTIDTLTPNTATTSDYPQVQAVLHSAGGGAWTREASLTLALAAQTGVRLDESTLIYSDVRDLMALQQTLRETQARTAKHR